MKKAICLVSILCLFLYSCSKEIDKTLLLSKNNIEFTSIGGEQQITVSGNVEWVVKYEANWLNAETRGNKHDRSIVITVQSNYLTPERSSKILITTPSGDIIGEINISQKGHIGSSFPVYDTDGTPFKGSMELVGKPQISAGSFNNPDGFPASTFGPASAEYPWVISGEVKGGIMNINFPIDKLELTSEYGRFTGFVMGQIFIEQKNSLSIKIGLHKKGDKFDNTVYILYVDNDFTNELVTFKGGWNFVEIYYNPNWVHDGDEPSRLIGIISQDVNVFLEKGYRWQIEHWLGGL